MGRRADAVLKEVLSAIDVVNQALEGVRQAQFAKDLFMQRGVERSLEIISKAVRHLPDELLARRPEIPWADIRTIGNRLRHEYWRVDPGIVWDVVQSDLPTLRTAIEAMLEEQRD